MEKTFLNSQTHTGPLYELARIVAHQWCPNAIPEPMNCVFNRNHPHAIDLQLFDQSEKRSTNVLYVGHLAIMDEQLYLANYGGELYTMPANWLTSYAGQRHLVNVVFGALAFDTGSFDGHPPFHFIGYRLRRR